MRHRLARRSAAGAAWSRAPLPTLGFTITFLTTHELRLGLYVGIGLAVVLLRRPHRDRASRCSTWSTAWSASASPRSSPPGPARPRTSSCPGIIYNAVYAVVLTLSILVRWPVVGLMLALGHRRPHGLAQGPGRRQALQPADPGAGRAVHRAGRGAVAALPGRPRWAGSASRRSRWAGRCRSRRWRRWSGCWPAAGPRSAGRRRDGRPPSPTRSPPTVSGRAGRAAPRAAGPSPGWRRTAARHRPRAGRPGAARSAGPRG